MCVSKVSGRSTHLTVVTDVRYEYMIRCLTQPPDKIRSVKSDNPIYDHLRPCEMTTPTPLLQTKGTNVKRFHLTVSREPQHLAIVMFSHLCGCVVIATAQERLRIMKRVSQAGYVFS